MRSLLRQTVHRLIQSSYSRWVRVFSVTASIYLSIVEFSFNDFVTFDLKLEHGNRKNSPVDQHRSIDLSHNNICHRAEEHLIDWLRCAHCTLEIDIKCWFEHSDYSLQLWLWRLGCEHLSASLNTRCLCLCTRITLQLSIVATNRNHWIIVILMWIKSVICVRVCVNSIQCNGRE